MYLAVLLGVLAAGLSGSCEKHSLINIYTTFSKNPDLPGFHQFTAMGLLDGKTVSYFDSDTRKKEPRQEGMKDPRYAGYWVQKTESCISKEQQFMDITQTLKDRLRQNDNDMHVLQRIHGCEATLTDGRLKLSHIIDRYRYDGQSLLYFNETNDRWVADLVAAKEIEMKWNKEPGMKDRMEIYLHNECMDEMSRFLGYEEEQLKNAPPPDVFIFSKKTRDSANIRLICFTTGFYRKDIDLNIKRDGRVLTLEDGVKSSGTRPNEDDTYQRRDMVEILQTDTAKYSCEVIHRASKVHVEEQWDGVLPGDSNWGLIIGGGVGGSVLLVVVVLVLIIIAVVKRLGTFKTPPVPRQGSVRSVGSSSSSGSSDSNNTDGSGQPLISVSPVSEDVPNPSDRPDEEKHESSAPPEVFLSSEKTSDPSNIWLICFTTGFYPKDIDVNIKRDGRILFREDGVTSSGIRPNGDDTYQRRDMVEILRTDTAKYSCEVIHRASKLHVEKQWDGVLPDDSNWDLIIGVLGGLVLLVVVLVLGVAFAWLKRHGPFKSCLRPRRVSDSSINSRVRNLTDGSGQPLVFLSQKHESSAPPDVVLSSKKTSDSSTVLLICFATGFYPNDIELNIKRDGRILTLEDGVMSLVIRPNGDDTYQRIDSVKILRTDTANYSCEVIHRASELHVEKQWEVRSRSWECRHTDSSDEE